MVTIELQKGTERKALKVDTADFFAKFHNCNVALCLNAAGVFLSDWRGGMEIVVNGIPATIYTEVADDAKIEVKQVLRQHSCPFCG